jgi:hypothetical protein
MAPPRARAENFILTMMTMMMMFETKGAEAEKVYMAEERLQWTWEVEKTETWNEICRLFYGQAVFSLAYIALIDYGCTHFAAVLKYRVWNG